MRWGRRKQTKGHGRDDPPPPSPLLRPLHLHSSSHGRCDLPLLPSSFRERERESDPKFRHHPSSAPNLVPPDLLLGKSVATTLMKRLSSSDSRIPICPPVGQEKGMYGNGFPSILDGFDEEDCGEDEMCSSGGGGPPGSAAGEKKRRLSVDQVRALEKNFEVENKLDPERKVRLATELSLEPRQVAVWFQNRRARWKTKQLERDYAALKANYDALRLDFGALHHDKKTLHAEIKELKAKLAEGESFSSVKEEPVASESEIKASEVEPPVALIYKDGSSDSDSSAVVNDAANPYHMVSSSTASGIPSTPSMGFNNDDNPTSIACSPFLNSEYRAHKGGLGLGLGFSFQHQMLKAEEHGFLAGEEPCSSFFSDDQPPTLPWCCSDQWNWVDGGGDNNIGRREGPF